MNKGRLLLFTSVIVCAFALTAVPALAQFESNSSELKGPGKSGQTVFEGGGGKVSCASASGTWKLASKVSENLNLNVETWSECKAESPIKTSATLKSCELQIRQPSKGETTATGTVITECTIKASLCEIKVKPENNKGLKTVTLANKGTNELEATAAIEGITTSVSSACSFVGIKAGKESKLKGVSTAVGVKEI